MMYDDDDEQIDPNYRVSPDQLAEEIVDQFAVMARFWAQLPDKDPTTGRVLTIEDRCMGVVHSILVQLDGCGALPAFKLVSQVHPDDEDQSYQDVEVETMLHDLLYRNLR